MGNHRSVAPKLIQQALEAGDVKIKAAGTDAAQQKGIARRRQRDVLDLAGSLEWDAEDSYRKERSRR